MKIAIIIDGLGVGGAERQAVQAAAALRRLGADVELISYGQPNDYADWIDRQEIPFTRIDARGPLRIGRLMALRRHLRQGGFDVVHAFKRTSSIWGRWAAKWARVPCIFGGYRGLTREGWLTRFLNRRLTEGTAGWIVNCSAIKQFIVKDMGLDPARVFVVPNAIDPAQFQSELTAEQARARFSVPADHVVVTMIGNLRPVKNPEMFLRVACRIARTNLSCALLLAGRGPLLAELRQKVAQDGLDQRVRLLGLVGDIPALLRATDVVALTSLSEGLPNSLLEAGAAGLPCVSTDSGGASEVIVEGVTGYLTAVGDEQALERRLRELIDDPNLRAKMGRAARLRIEDKFSPAALAENLLTVYGQCPRRGAAGGGKNP